MSRKRKANTDLSTATGITYEPVIFVSPGLENDIRLNVLGVEYHLHSVILKVYFRRFLDSADKTKKPSSSRFRYEYTSVIDAEEVSNADAVAWSLQPTSKVGQLSCASCAC